MCSPQDHKIIMGMRGRNIRENLAEYFTFEEESDDEYCPEVQTSSEEAAPTQQSGGGKRGGRFGQRRPSSGDASSEGDLDEDVDMSKLSPESQRRVKRRMANRNCARRIRQRKQDLLATLTTQLDDLKSTNTQLVGELAGVAAVWRDISKENCKVEADLMMARALRQGRGNHAKVLQAFNRLANTETAVLSSSKAVMT